MLLFLSICWLHSGLVILIGYFLGSIRLIYFQNSNHFSVDFSLIAFHSVMNNVHIVQYRKETPADSFYPLSYSLSALSHVYFLLLLSFSPPFFSLYCLFTMNSLNRPLTHHPIFAFSLSLSSTTSQSPTHQKSDSSIYRYSFRLGRQVKATQRFHFPQFISTSLVA